MTRLPSSTVTPFDLAALIALAAAAVAAPFAIIAAALALARRTRR